jgi:hypothetical protein
MNNNGILTIYEYMTVFEREREREREGGVQTAALRPAAVVPAPP